MSKCRNVRFFFVTCAPHGQVLLDGHVLWDRKQRGGFPEAKVQPAACLHAMAWHGASGPIRFSVQPQIQFSVRISIGFAAQQLESDIDIPDSSSIVCARVKPGRPAGDQANGPRRCRTGQEPWPQRRGRVRMRMRLLARAPSCSRGAYDCALRLRLHAPKPSFSGAPFGVAAAATIVHPARSTTVPRVPLETAIR